MRSFILLFTLLWMTGCSTLKVATDYDPSADLNGSKKFAIIHKYLEGEDTLTSDRIMAALKKELLAKGYVASSKDEADLYFLFHVGVTSKTRIQTDYQYVNMYPYSYGYRSVAIPQTREYSYQEAKLIVDAVIPHVNKIVWRGTAVDYLKTLETPQERRRYIDKVMKALMKKFPR